MSRVYEVCVLETPLGNNINRCRERVREIVGEREREMVGEKIKLKWQNAIQLFAFSKSLTTNGPKWKNDSMYARILSL